MPVVELQAHNNALADLEEANIEAAALRASSPAKALRMSRSDSEEEELMSQQVLVASDLPRSQRVKRSPTRFPVPMSQSKARLTDALLQEHVQGDTRPKLDRISCHVHRRATAAGRRRMPTWRSGVH